MIIPSIDIQDGRVVQLRQGRDLLLTDDRPADELAAYFGRFGPVAVVDLDAAMGKGSNTELIARCCKVASCRVGGGIRSADDVRAWIQRGADKVVIGTMATPEFLKPFPPDWIVAAVDARGNEVVTHGWQTAAGENYIDRARRIAPYCGAFLYTQVEREGMLGGGDLDGGVRLRDAVQRPVTLAGGIASEAEVQTVIEAGLSAQLGRAVYENKLDLTAAWVQAIRFDAQGLVPTIVQDVARGDVLMLAYSNAESLRRALTDGAGWYYSRSRKELWRKGATSGHTQRLVSARWDCDRDAVRFQVEQTGPACHQGSDTCFGDARAGLLDQLQATLLERRRTAPEGSYSARLFDDDELVAAKLREEIEEVIEARDSGHIAWEAADVIYHLLARILADDVTLEDVRAHLRSRFKP